MLKTDTNVRATKVGIIIRNKVVIRFLECDCGLSVCRQSVSEHADMEMHLRKTEHFQGSRVLQRPQLPIGSSGN